MYKDTIDILQLKKTAIKSGLKFMREDDMSGDGLTEWGKKHLEWQQGRIKEIERVIKLLQNAKEV